MLYTVVQPSGRDSMQGATTENVGRKYYPEWVKTTITKPCNDSFCAPGFPYFRGEPEKVVLMGVVGEPMSSP